MLTMYSLPVLERMMLRITSHSQNYVLQYISILVCFLPHPPGQAQQPTPPARFLQHLCVQVHTDRPRDVDRDPARLSRVEGHPDLDEPRDRWALGGGHHDARVPAPERKRVHVRIAERRDGRGDVDVYGDAARFHRSCDAESPSMSKDTRTDSWVGEKRTFEHGLEVVVCYRRILGGVRHFVGVDIEPLRYPLATC